MLSILRLLPICLVVASLSGCALLKDMSDFEDIKPWHRDVLAQDKMQTDANAMDKVADEKIYFSREASRGGGGFGGGGCGCN